MVSGSFHNAAGRYNEHQIVALSRILFTSACCMVGTKDVHFNSLFTIERKKITTPNKQSICNQNAEINFLISGVFASVVFQTYVATRML